MILFIILIVKKIAGMNQKTPMYKRIMTFLLKVSVYKI